MKEQLEGFRVKLAERLEEAEQEAKYARSADQHTINRIRAQESGWCYQELTAILQQNKNE